MGLYRYNKAPASIRRWVALVTSWGICAVLLVLVGLSMLSRGTSLEVVDGARHLSEDDEEKGYWDDLIIDRPYNKSSRRWLVFVHIIVIAYMLLGLNTVCDIYFTGSLDEMVNQWSIKPDVAGATFMAAGGSAPELFTSLIGTLILQNDVGFGTIVGSAVFNVLFVIGLCGFAAEAPIKLSWWPLARDCTYYIVALSVLALFAKTNKKIELWEALVLFVGYCGYCTMMYFNPQLEEMANKLDIVAEMTPVTPIPDQKTVAGTIQETDVLEAPWKLEVFGVGGVAVTVDGEYELQGSYNSSPAWQKVDDTNLWLVRSADDYWSVKTQEQKDNNSREGYLQSKEKWEEKSLPKEVSKNQWQVWNGDEWVDQVVEVLIKAGQKWSMEHSVKDHHHIKVSQQHFQRKTVRAEAPIQSDQTDVELAESVSLEDVKKAPSIVEEEDEDDVEALLLPPVDTLPQIIWGISLPVYVCLYYGIPKPSETTFVSTFIVSLCWIAFFSFFLVYCVEILGAVLNIHSIVMGFTLLAAGTSIPDLVSSMAVARAGEGDMAISSSIGSNIFDILVGLPIPWVIKIFFAEMLVKGDWDFGVTIKSEYILLYVLILIFMVFCVICSIHFLGWMLNRKLGVGMAALYALFLLIVLLVEFNKPEFAKI